MSIGGGGRGLRLRPPGATDFRRKWGLLIGCPRAQLAHDEAMQPNHFPGDPLHAHLGAEFGVVVHEVQSVTVGETQRSRCLPNG